MQLEQVKDYTVVAENLDPQNCPLDLKLELLCDGQPCLQSSLGNYLSAYELNGKGSTTMEIYTADPRLIGEHLVEVRAFDEKNGFTTPT